MERRARDLDVLHVLELDARDGNSVERVNQFIIATHLTILLSCEGAV